MEWYQEGILDIEWEEPMLIILLMQEYPYFMGIINERKHQL